jgi:hypothetical protein
VAAQNADFLRFSSSSNLSRASNVDLTMEGESGVAPRRCELGSNSEAMSSSLSAARDGAVALLFLALGSQKESSSAETSWIALMLADINTNTTETAARLIARGGDRGRDAIDWNPAIVAGLSDTGHKQSSVAGKSETEAERRQQETTSSVLNFYVFARKTLCTDPNQSGSDLAQGKFGTLDLYMLYFVSRS